MSPEKTVALVPSENVALSMPQSSTSTGLALSTALSSGRRHAVTLPTSHVTLATVIVSPRAGLDLLEIEHRRKRMASHPDQRAAACHRPLRGVRGMRSG